MILASKEHKLVKFPWACFLIYKIGTIMPDTFVVCLHLDNEWGKNFVECQRKMWNVYGDITEHALELDPVAWCQQYFQWNVWQHGGFS